MISESNQGTRDSSVPDPITAALRFLPDGVNRREVRSALQDFLKMRGGDLSPPHPAEVGAFIARLAGSGNTGETQRRISFFQSGASVLWGTDETSWIARTYRNAMVKTKKARRSEWQNAEAAIAGLPEPWRDVFRVLLETSKAKTKTTGQFPLSASRITAMARALIAWREFKGDALPPTAIGLEAYAEALKERGVSANSVADYLERVATGYFTIVRRESIPFPVRFVLIDHDERRTRPMTKTQAQIVGPKILRDLATDLFQEARAMPVRGLSSACKYRNGLLILMALASVDRVRAISSFEFDRTVRLGARPLVHISLPGTFLKVREGDKNRETSTYTLSSTDVWDALTEYREHFRPLFDGAQWLFPSVHSPGSAVSEKQLSRLVGNITEARLGIRIPIHRFRDNAATEAGERWGGISASALLGHRDLESALAYDHSQALDAQRELASVFDGLRGDRVGLDL